MAYVNRKQIEAARQMDLLTYLQNYEPDQLIPAGQGTYKLREHDSLKISNGKWCWWSHECIGGRSALDFLVKVRGMPFHQAVEHLLSCTKVYMPQISEEIPIKQFQLPAPYENNKRVFAYLRSRGIEPYLINYCIKRKFLYEDAVQHNAVFVGYDEKQQARYGFMRGTLSKYTFMREVLGSDKRYSFYLPAKSQEAQTVCVFESAIDVLSYASIRIICKLDWQENHLLSLGGVYQKKADAAKLPIALEHFLKRYPQVKQIKLCLDRDEVGLAAGRLITQAAVGKTVIEDFPKVGKDYNDMLCSIVNIQSPPETRKSKEGQAR